MNDDLKELVFLFDSVDTVNHSRNRAETLQQEASNPIEYVRMSMHMEECDKRKEETVARIQELGGVSEQEREEVENFRLARRQRSRLEGIRQSEVPLAQAPSDDTIGVGSPPPSDAKLPLLAGQGDQDVEESKLPPLRQPSPVSINARAPSDDTIGVGSPPPSDAKLPPLAGQDDQDVAEDNHRPLQASLLNPRVSCLVTAAAAWKSYLTVPVKTRKWNVVDCVY